MAILRAANPKWYFSDLTGNPLDDSYWAFFLTNTVPYTPQDVYQDAAGTTPWNNAMVQFDSSGTLPDNLYFDDSLVYRIEIRQGNLASDPLIWEVNDFVPNPNATTSSSLVITPSNQITNPQFAVINFNNAAQPHTISSPGTYEIAAGWFLTLVGAGTANLTQVPFQALDAVSGNPSYALDLNLNGWTGQAILFQRFSKVPGLWGSSYATFTMVAKSQDGSSHNFTVNWIPSSGNPTAITANTITTGYQDFPASKQIVAPTGTDLSDDAYIDLQIGIPGTCHVLLTNIQFVGGLLVATTLPYEQDSYERQVDHLYHNERADLLIKPATDFLTGWDFGLNPWQFNDPSVPVAIGTVFPSGGAANYTADQTVVASENTNGIIVSNGTTANSILSIQSNGLASVDNFAVIQYIDLKSARPLIGQRVSIAVQARTQFNTSGPLQLKARILGFTDPNPVGFPLTPFIANPWSIPNPVFNPRFVAVASPVLDVTRYISNDDSSLFTGSEVNNVYTFNNFDLSNPAFQNCYLAVVLFTTNNMGGATSRLHVQRVGLTVGEIASLPATKTFDETLNQCRYYYEKSYEVSASNNDYDNGAHTNNQLIYPMSVGVVNPGPNIGFNRDVITIDFKAPKRIQPSMNIYNPDAASSPNQVRFTIYSNNTSTTETFSALYGLASNGTDRVSFRSLANSFWPTTGTATGQTAAARFHYTADSRIGYV